MSNTGTARTQVQQMIDSAKSHSARKMRDAHKVWRAAAECSSRLLGAHHETTIFCYNSVGRALIDIENFDEAIPLLEAQLKQAQSLYGFIHNTVEQLCQALARAYRKVGNHDMQHKHWLAAGFSSERQRSCNHNTTIFCYHQAARALASQRRFEEALPLFLKVLAATKVVHGRGTHLAYAARDTATCYNQLEKYDEALPLWKLCVNNFRKDDAKQAPVRQKALSCLIWTRCRIAGQTETSPAETQTS